MPAGDVEVRHGECVVNIVRVIRGVAPRCISIQGIHTLEELNLSKSGRGISVRGRLRESLLIRGFRCRQVVAREGIESFLVQWRQGCLQLPAV